MSSCEKAAGRYMLKRQEAGISFPQWKKSLPQARFSDTEDSSRRYLASLCVLKTQECAGSVAQEKIVRDHNFQQQRGSSTTLCCSVRRMPSPSIVETRWWRMARSRLTWIPEEKAISSLGREPKARCPVPVWESQVRGEYTFRATTSFFQNEAS